MEWKNILKAYGDKHKKDDGSTHIEGYGFPPKPYPKDKHPNVRDKDGTPYPEDSPERGKSVDLVNWFKSIQQTFDTMLGNLDVEVISSKDKSGFKEMKREGSYAGKMITKHGQEISKGIVDTMLEGYLQGIAPTPSDSNNAKFMDDSTTNIQSIMSSSGYSRTTEAGLKVAEEMLTDFLESSYRTIKAMHDASDGEEDVESIEVDPEKPVPIEFIDEVWDGNLGDSVISDITDLNNTIEEKLEDIITDSTSFDLDDDGTPDVSKEDIIENIKLEIKKHTASPEFVDSVKQFVGNVSFTFQLKYLLAKESMESNPEVADQVTEEEAAERRSRPKVDMSDDYDNEQWKRTQDDNKSNDQRTSKLDWQSILQKEVGLTTNAGFTPAIHNTTFGEKKPCEGCKERKKKCCE
tara:strand:+ start:14674 stop:15894 length:1221 start_codon:yes stop_codon:yes gene_type:complete